MRKLTVFFILGLALSLAMPAWAGKPTDENGVPFGNGFPSGEHFNLLIHGKKADFSCPAIEYDETGQQVFGNVINIPREQNNDPITILMESGRKGPKGAPDTAKLEVTDWCSESFADYGENQGDPAVMRLPQNDKGYAVYGRILGKPGKDIEPTVTIVPELYYVEDESGNDLILLGLVDQNGVSTFSSDSMTLVRNDISTKGKGALKATNLTGLFEWTGEVCYVQEDSDLYCLDEQGVDQCSALNLCCTDPEADGIYNSCDLLSTVGVIAEDGTTITCPSVDINGNAYTAVEAQCKQYENEWVFNISDFVGYLWNLDSTGAYNIQIRFYPIK